MKKVYHYKICKDFSQAFQEDPLILHSTVCALGGKTLELWAVLGTYKEKEIVGSREELLQKFSMASTSFDTAKKQLTEKGFLWQEDFFICFAADGKRVFNPKLGDEKVDICDPNFGVGNTDIHNPNFGYENRNIYNPSFGDEKEAQKNPKSGDENRNIYNPKSGYEKEEVSDPKSGYENMVQKNPNFGVENVEQKTTLVFEVSHVLSPTSVPDYDVFQLTDISVSSSDLKTIPSEPESWDEIWGWEDFFCRGHFVKRDGKTAIGGAVWRIVPKIMEWDEEDNTFGEDSVPTSGPSLQLSKTDFPLAQLYPPYTSPWCRIEEMEPENEIAERNFREKDDHQGHIIYKTLRETLYDSKNGVSREIKVKNVRGLCYTDVRCDRATPMEIRNICHWIGIDTVAELLQKHSYTLFMLKKGWEKKGEYMAAGGVENHGLFFVPSFKKELEKLDIEERERAREIVNKGGK